MNEGGKPDKIDVNALFSQLWNESETEKVEQEQETVLSTTTLTNDRLAKVRAQKANSFLGAMAKGSLYTLPDTELLLLDDSDEIVMAAFKRLESERSFLRTCPETARHGVLESVEVNEDNIIEEWTRLRNVMKEVEPNGSFLLQPFVDATSSGVMGSQMYTVIGEGFDGVTNESALQLYFIMDHEDDSCTKEQVALGHEKDNFEIEFVYKRDENFTRNKHQKGELMMTQIRGAPPRVPRAPPFVYGDKVADTDGAVPQGRVEVKEVWEASGLEEVEWLEREITKEKCADGFVISHPKGSLGSHICAHARQHEIPYVVGEVNVGEVWVEGSPTWVAKEENGVEIVPRPYDPYHETYVNAFHTGLIASKHRYTRQHGWFGHFFHQWQGLNVNGASAATLGGMFAGWVVKAALSVCFGEMRNGMRGSKKDMTPEVMAVLSAAVGIDNIKEVKPTATLSESVINRQHWFAVLDELHLEYHQMAKALRWCAFHFKDGWRSGYGGTNWMKCAEEAAIVADRIEEFLSSEGDVDVLKSLVSKLNEVENWHHNNGSLFNKFLHNTAFDYATKNKDGKSGYFPHSETGVASMFRAYELAREVYKGEDKARKTPALSWTDLFAATGKAPSYWKQNNLGRIPVDGFKAELDRMSTDMLHFKNKYTENDDYFIPCGRSSCEVCEQKMFMLSVIDAGGLDYQTMLLTGDAPSVYLALPRKSSLPITHAVCGLLQERKYKEVTGEMFVEAWKGLNIDDKVYTPMSNLLKKFLKKQLTQKTEDGKAWVNQVHEMMQGGVE